ncbi:variable surface lipoprotein [Mycoplasmopsis agassizii]|uniref:variable surface lipoprotein n=1 Tax=Mycoplasmopsis agassizii TaxID=33922 RepID=UPI00352711BC
MAFINKQKIIISLTSFSLISVPIVAIACSQKVQEEQDSWLVNIKKVIDKSSYSLKTTLRSRTKDQLEKIIKEHVDTNGTSKLDELVETKSDKTILESLSQVTISNLTVNKSLSEHQIGVSFKVTSKIKTDLFENITITLIDVATELTDDNNVAPGLPKQKEPDKKTPKKDTDSDSKQTEPKKEKPTPDPNQKPAIDKPNSPEKPPKTPEEIAEESKWNAFSDQEKVDYLVAQVFGKITFHKNNESINYEQIIAESKKPENKNKFLQMLKEISNEFKNLVEKYQGVTFEVSEIDKNAVYPLWGYGLFKYKNASRAGIANFINEVK